MKTFHFYIDDAGSGAPRELVVETRDEARAREMAEEMLRQSPEHLGVEVCDGGARVFGIGSFSERTWCENGDLPLRQTA
ncbi:MAG TPA: hypothetical protein VGI95_16290 [Caulobacteraceae bacterium]